MTDAVSLIRAKRDGQRLADDDIRWLFEAYARHEVADEQMSALLMAILLRGMAPAELARWTQAMIESGERLDLSGAGRPTVDKHSTGGVGDKITLPLAPLVAAHGVAVPQLSGRGLGHTGGTLDKLEAIPGWRARLSAAEFRAQLRDVGAVVCAAGESLAPADRKLYALRDVTGTVESVPLIASSIMSKKIAEGTGALVLDVKFGSGAFMSSWAAPTASGRSRWSPGWTPRSGAPPATAWRWPSRSRCSPAAARPTWWSSRWRWRGRCCLPAASRTPTRTQRR